MPEKEYISADTIEDVNHIPQNEQWLLDGDCQLCRRSNYCDKWCKKAKLRRDKFLREAVSDAFCEMVNIAKNKQMEEKTNDETI